MVYEIKSFTGLSPYADKGPAGSFKFGSNLDVRKFVDSLSCGQALTDEGTPSSRSPSLSVSPSSSASRSPSTSPSGSVSPTPSPSASQSPSASASPSASTSPSHSASSSPSQSVAYTTIFRDLVRWFVNASNGYTYGFGSTGYVYRRDADALWNIEYKDPDGAIKGAAEWYSSTKTFLYFATDTKLKRKVLPGRSDWNDVETVGTLTSADWHTMREAGGSLIICNRENLALVGYDESFTNEALNLIPGNYSKTIVERNGRSIIGTARSSDPTRGVNGAIDTEVQLAQVGSDGEIFFANGSDTVPVRRFPGGGKVNPGGVANEVSEVNFFEWEQNALSWIDKQSVGNMALFAVYGAETGKGGVYTYGRKDKDKPFALNLEYQLDADELGAVVHVNGTTLVSYQDGSDFGVKAVDPDNKATATYEGLDLYAKVKRPIDIVPWHQVEMLMAPLPDGCAVRFYYKMNKNGSFIQAKTADGLEEFRYRNARKAVFRVGAEGEIFEPRVVLVPTGNYTPEIYKMFIHFAN